MIGRWCKWPYEKAALTTMDEPATLNGKSCQNVVDLLASLAGCTIRGCVLARHRKSGSHVRRKHTVIPLHWARSGDWLALENTSEKTSAMWILKRLHQNLAALMLSEITTVWILFWLFHILDTQWLQTVDPVGGDWGFWRDKLMQGPIQLRMSYDTCSPESWAWETILLLRWETVFSVNKIMKKIAGKL